jgi:hypothetical protein
MRRVIRRHLRRRTGGLDIDADVNAVIAVNRGDGQTEAVQSTSIRHDASAHAQSGGGEAAADHRDNPDRRSDDRPA